MSTVFNDNPENYRKMSEPFETPEKANEALENFYNELSELRKKHNISDILVVIEDSSKYSDGKIGTFMQCLQFGNSLKCETLAAYAYGQATANHRELLNKLLDGKTHL